MQLAGSLHVVDHLGDEWLEHEVCFRKVRMVRDGVVNLETLGRRWNRHRMLMTRSGGRARLALGQVPGAVLAPRELLP